MDFFQDKEWESSVQFLPASDNTKLEKKKGPGKVGAIIGVIIFALVVALMIGLLVWHFHCKNSFLFGIFRFLKYMITTKKIDLKIQSLVVFNKHNAFGSDQRGCEFSVLSLWFCSQERRPGQAAVHRLHADHQPSV